MVLAKDLQSDEFASFYKPYIEKVGNDDLITILNKSGEDLIFFLNSIPAEKLEYSYAEGKWTIKEVLLHIIDAERIFCYRALRFARNDKTSLQGFDENNYVPESFANSRTIGSLIDEYKKQRASTLALFSSFSEDIMKRKGIANENYMSIRALGFVICGHEKHHCEVIKERYL